MKRMKLRHSLPGIALLLLMMLSPRIDAQSRADPEDAALWEAVARGGHVLLMRQALAPGTGDPAGFQLGDCATQRNLSAQGRRQARAVGARLRSQGIRELQVYSSQWCRCLETARLLGLGEVRPLPALNSFFDAPRRRAEQTAGAIALIRSSAVKPSLILVTHQVNITALTGIVPDSGEILVLRPEADKLPVIGRLRGDGVDGTAERETR